MSEYENTSRRKKKKKKLKVGRIIIALIIVLALVVGGYFVFTKILFPSNTAEPEVTEEISEEVVYVKPMTTFAEQAKAEYEGTEKWGDESEVYVAAKYFGTSLFTMWGTDPSLVDYSGLDMLPDLHAADFDKQVRNNMYFQFPQVVAKYGAENLPIVTNVESTVDDWSYIEYNGEYYDSYTVTMIMYYQDGTAEGTQNEDYEKTNELLQQWVRSATVEFFWLPNEDGSGSWKVASVKHVVNIANSW